MWKHLSLIGILLAAVLASSNANASVVLTERAITISGATDRSASASGADTAYTSNRGGDFDLWFESGGIEFLIAGGVGAQTSPSLDSTRIAYVDTSAGNNNIAWVDVMVGSVTYLTIGGASDRDPAISGDLVAFVSDQSGSSGIFVAEIGTGIVFTVADGPNAEIDPDIDAGTIVWSTYQNGSFDIFASDFGGVPFAVADGPGQEVTPSISGDRIAYIVDDDIALFDRSTDVTTQITLDGFIQRDVIVAGDRLAWADDRNGNDDIFVYDLIDGQTYQLTSDPSVQTLTGFTGDRVIFDDLRSGDLNVWEVSFSINHAPATDAGPDVAVRFGDVVSLSGSAADPDGDPIVSWQWSVDTAPAGSVAQPDDPTSAATTFTPDVDGEYMLSLTASDGVDVSEPDTVAVNVADNQPPEATPTATPVEGDAPLLVDFNANATDLDGDEISYVWDFGDPSSIDNTNTEPNPSHTYNDPGTYVVWLTVSDGFYEVSVSIIIVVHDVQPEIRFDVTRAKVQMRRRCGGGRGSVSVRAEIGTMIPTGDTLVAMEFDGIMLFAAPFSEFENKGHQRYRLKHHEHKVWIDFERGIMRVCRKNIELDGFDNSNGVETVMYFGENTGIDHFIMTQHQRSWFYRR